MSIQNKDGSVRQGLAWPGPLRSVLDMEAPDVRPLTENLTSRTNKRKKIFGLQPEKKPPGHLEQRGLSRTQSEERRMDTNAG